MRSANVTTFTPSSGGTPTPFQYIGAQQYQKDGDSGLSLVGNRYYDSDSGRFISQDPAQAGDNPYAYCDNNPLASTDPSGLDAQASGFGTPMRANLGDGGNGAPKTGSQYDPTPKPGTMGPPAPKPDTPKPDSKQKASPKPGWHPMPGYEWVPNPDRPGQWTMKPILPTLPEGTQNPISGPFPGNLPGPPSAPWRGTISGRGYSATGGYNPFNGDYGGVIHYDRWVAQGGRSGDIFGWGFGYESEGCFGGYSQTYSGGRSESTIRLGGSWHPW